MKRRVFSGSVLAKRAGWQAGSGEALSPRLSPALAR